MFDAYGDERCGREYITYGLVLVPGDKSELRPKSLGRSY